MNTRGVIGKRIVAVRQRREHNDRLPRGTSMAVEAIVLEDGTELQPYTEEWEDGYSTDFRVVRPERRGGGQDGTDQAGAG